MLVIGVRGIPIKEECEMGALSAGIRWISVGPES